MNRNNRKNNRANPEGSGRRSKEEFDLMLLRMLLRVIFHARREMAGKKGRSGRKSNAEIEKCRLLIAQALGESDWQRIFAELGERAKNGSVAHMKVLFAYAFGIPTETNNPAATQNFVKLVEVIRAAQKDSAPAKPQRAAKGRRKKELQE